MDPTWSVVPIAGVGAPLMYGGLGGNDGTTVRGSSPGGGLRAPPAGISTLGRSIGSER
jgi:hypothetical protein